MMFTEAPVLPTLEPRFWLPPWRVVRGITIPLPLPGDRRIIDPSSPGRYERRPSGLHVPPRMPQSIWFIVGSPPWAALAAAGIQRPEDCACTACEAERVNEEAIADIPRPVYDAERLPDGPVDNDMDPMWAVRADSSGPGLLIEDLLDDSTKEFIRKRDARRTQTRS